MPTTSPVFCFPPCPRRKRDFSFGGIGSRRASFPDCSTRSTVQSLERTILPFRAKRCHFPCPPLLLHYPFRIKCASTLSHVSSAFPHKFHTTPNNLSCTFDRWYKYVHYTQQRLNFGEGVKLNKIRSIPGKTGKSFLFWRYSTQREFPP